jgi:hypothetical protein
LKLTPAPGEFLASHLIGGRYMRLLGPIWTMLLRGCCTVQEPSSVTARSRGCGPLSRYA